MVRRFWIAKEEEIKRGEVTDVYFLRTERILEARGLANKRVVAEVTASRLPENWEWGVLCGVEEVVRLLEGLPVTVYGMQEGTVFRPRDRRGYKVPVMVVEGPYGAFCRYETPLLGLLCQASGIATRAARIRKLAGDKLLLSFGIRRMHPGIAPMIDRAAYIGGVDAVSCVLSAKLLKKPAVGTMPHALIIVVGDQIEAWRAFDEVVESEVPRIALVDTYFDEKVEAIMAAEALGERLWGVRLDTPSSRRGSYAEIIREVRWELDVRGFKHVKIVVSGGITERNIRELIEAGAEAFGVGTWLSNAPVVDFALDLVEVEGHPAAKRGKLGGKKQVWRCWHCFLDELQPYEQPAPTCPNCGRTMEPLLKPLLVNGESKPLPSIDEIRAHVLNQLKHPRVEVESK